MTISNFKAKVDLTGLAAPEEKAKKMYNAGYRFVGRHSAIKICEWTREAIRGKKVCYKCQFYGIETHRCIQMSPVVFHCDFNCMHCWRSLNFSLPPKNMKWDPPEVILDGCIEEQRNILKGFWGSITDKKKLKEAENPNQIAISLSGEPTLYPYLPEFIDLAKERGFSVYLVTNGCHPEMIEKLKGHEPTNLYMTLPAPNKEQYMKECVPIIKDGWERIMKTLGMMKDMKTRTVIRLTLNRKHNMMNAEEYGKMLDKSGATFVECKAFMAVGGAREKMGVDAMPLHKEIREFAEQIEKHSSYKIKDEKKDSRVVLLENNKKAKS